MSRHQTNVRVAAAQIVAAVIQHDGSLSTLIPSYINQVPDRDRSLLQELCYGTLRWQPKLQSLLGQLLARPFKAKDADINALLACALYQMLETRIPPHAVVNEAVAACKPLKKTWAKGLVNAVLRRFQREQQALSAELSDNPQWQTAHPQWLLDLWHSAWPDQLDNIVAGNNARPPMALRVNRLQISRDDYLQQLADADIAASIAPFSRDGIYLAQPGDVSSLPGFAQGLVSVQDEAAQLATELLQPQRGERVLDACCAPGGKTCHILERLGDDGEVVAIDIEPGRLERVEENLQRLGLRARLIAGDAADTQSWWDGQPFDRILLDAPCSATGVIRRHPDIKLLRKPADIVKLAALQLSLLQALWPLLKVGGTLLYATCSTLPEENDTVVNQFLHTTKTAAFEAITGEYGFSTPAAKPIGRQLLPQPDGHDGFYYARLTKNAAIE